MMGNHRVGVEDTGTCNILLGNIDGVICHNNTRVRDEIGSTESMLSGHMNGARGHNNMLGHIAMW